MSNLSELRIRDTDALDRAFRATRFLLFKHSPICPLSAEAYDEVEAYLFAHPEVECGWVDVISDRPLARAVATRTAIRHESPQVLLLTEGHAVWSASHSRVTRRGLEKHASEG